MPIKSAASHKVLRHTIPIGLLIVFGLSTLVLKYSILPQREEVELEESMLPSSARDVIVLGIDFSQFGGDVLTQSNLKIIADIDSYIQELEGIRRYSSLLNATVIKAQYDEILVLPFIPDSTVDSYEQAEILELKRNYKNYPEIRPYLSPDFKACAFYLEPGLTYPEHRLIEHIETVQSLIREKYGITFEFTGLRPVRVFIERFIVRDIFKIFPLLFILISLLYYVCFRNMRVLILSWFVKILSTAFAYGCYLVWGKELSPFIILVPIFNVGLLSDYLIHMFYHIQGQGGFQTPHSARTYLSIPLSLTALSSIIGFLSLILLKGAGHILLAYIISISIVVTYSLTLWWIPAQSWVTKLAPQLSKTDVRSVTRVINQVLTSLFVFIHKKRRIALILCLLILLLAVYHLPDLELQPYPVQQLPESSTIIKSERLLNEKFSGTMPFRIEIDAKQAGTFLQKKNLHLLEELQTVLVLNPDVGFQNSVLTTIKRIHYYFNNSDPRYLAIPERENDEVFQSLIEQYLLFYSASASPVEYESLIDSNRRVIAIQGILKYRDTGSVNDFLITLDRMKEILPEEWCIDLYGPVDELVQRMQRLRNNWFVSFGSGSLLIFITVLVFLKNVKMAVVSLLPSFFTLVIITGISSMLGVKIDEYTLIFVPITTGLTIDYTIHTLNAIGSMKSTHMGSSAPHTDLKALKEYGSTLIRKSGVPVFLSFLTSVFAFVSLCLSSFSGAVHFGLMLSAAIGCSFFISVFLLPGFFLQGKIKNRGLKE